MNEIFWQFLLMVLPKLLEWLQKLLDKGKAPSKAESAKLGEILWYLDKVRAVAAKAGVKAAKPEDF